MSMRKKVVIKCCTNTISLFYMPVVLYVPIDNIANSSRRISNIRLFFGGKNGRWGCKRGFATV